MTTDTGGGPSPFRFVVATDWTKTSIPVALTATLVPACGHLPGVELVLATPTEPQGSDEQRALTLLKELDPESSLASVRVESFREVMSRPYDAAVIPTGDLDNLTLQLVEFGARMAEVAAHLRSGAPLSRPRNSGVPRWLEHALRAFANLEAEKDRFTNELAFRAARPPYQGTYVGNNRLLVRLSWFSTLYCHADEITRTPRLLMDGQVDGVRLQYIQSHLFQGGVGVHLNAGVGDEATFIAFRVGIQGTVLAAEADPHDLELLQLNLALGRYDDVLRLVAAQVDAEDGRAPLDRADGWFGPHVGNPWRLLQHRPTPVAEVAAPPQVDQVAFATLIRDLPAVDLVVSNAPHRVGRQLAAVADHLVSGRVQRFLAPIHCQARPEDWAQALRTAAQLDRSGCTICLVDDNGDAQPVTVDFLRDYAGYANLVVEHGGAR